MIAETAAIVLIVKALTDGGQKLLDGALDEAGKSVLAALIDKVFPKAKDKEAAKKSLGQNPSSPETQEKLKEIVESSGAARDPEAIELAQKIIIGVQNNYSGPVTQYNFYGTVLQQALQQGVAPSVILESRRGSKPWNVPFPPNPDFTGREDIIRKLHESLTAGKSTAITQQAQALSGLGGQGKTQTAVEYAYRYQEDYTAVLWIKAESPASLAESLVEIASLLDLPQKDERDQNIVVKAVKRWLLENIGWLIIFDNVDDLDDVEPLFNCFSHGGVLITTRLQTTGQLADEVQLDAMTPDEGALLLLRRAKIILHDAQLSDASDQQRNDACELSKDLGGLPLALDQAGAYIHETKSSIANYRKIVADRIYRRRALGRKGKGSVNSHESVLDTFTLAIERIEELNPAAAELIRCCAFLGPENIPEEIFPVGCYHLPKSLSEAARDAFSWNETVEIATRYSLLTRTHAQGSERHDLSIHRLVQAVIQDSLESDQKSDICIGLIKAMNAAFPDVTNYTNWSECERIILHVQVCSGYLTEDEISFEEAGRLLNQAGYYLDDRASYSDAEMLYIRALAIFESVYGGEHLKIAASLNNLALLYNNQGRYSDAEPLYIRALAIYEKVLGPEHPGTALSLNNLASLYKNQGRYADAEPLYIRALAINEKVHWPEHPDIAMCLNNLAKLYENQGKYADAEPLNICALTICERTLGPDHPNTATSISNLAELYRRQGRYADAEPLYIRALGIFEKTLGEDHPNTIVVRNNLAELQEEMAKSSV